MKKFLETFQPYASTFNLGQVWPEYRVMFEKIEDLDEQVKRGVSKQVEIEYYDLIEALDGFLLEKESIEKYNKVFPNKPLDFRLLERESEFDEEQAKSLLNKEIEDLMSDIDDDLVKAQVQSDQTKIVKRKSQKPAEIIKKEDLSEDQIFYGKQITYDSINETPFWQGLAMMKIGCKFFTCSFTTKHYAMFKISETQRLVIETNELKVKFDNLFGLTKGNQAYFLGRTPEDVEILFNLFRNAFDYDDADIFTIDEEFQYNSPPIYSSFVEGLLYQEVDFFSQNKALVERSKYIRTYFNLFRPLSEILTLLYCKKVYSNLLDRAGADDAKKIIDKNLETKTFRIEGIGDVIQPPVEELQAYLTASGVIDENFEPTPFAEAITSYNFAGQPRIIPEFRPFMFYINNLKKEFESKKEVFYSTYHNITLYHLKKSISEIDIAFPLSTEQKKSWNFKNETQNDSFPVQWQDNQEIKDYVEYLPFASGGNLRVNERTSEAKLRGLEDKINFKDDDKFDLYLANVKNPSFQWCINSSNYNYIKQMYSDRKIRILGPTEGTFSNKNNVFLHIVDDKNDILGIIRPVGKSSRKAQEVLVDDAGKIIEEMKSTAGQLDFELEFSWKELPLDYTPRPVWDTQDIITKLKEDGVYYDEGVYIDDATEEVNYDEEVEVKIDKPEPAIRPKEDIIIVDEEEQIVDADPDMSVLEQSEQEIEDDEVVKEFMFEISSLQEALEDLGGQDDEIEKEIQDLQNDLKEYKENI